MRSEEELRNLTGERALYDGPIWYDDEDDEEEDKIFQVILQIRNSRSIPPHHLLHQLIPLQHLSLCKSISHRNPTLLSPSL